MFGQRQTTPDTGLARRPSERGADELVWYYYLHAQRRLCDTGGMLLTPKQRTELHQCYDLAKKSPERYAFLYFVGGKTFTSPIGDWPGNANIPQGFTFSGYYAVTLSGPGEPRREGWHWWNRAEDGYMAGGFMNPGKAAPDPGVTFARPLERRITEVWREPQWVRIGDPVQQAIAAGAAKITVSGGGVASKFMRG